jgi:MFS family permease
MVDADRGRGRHVHAAAGRDDRYVALPQIQKAFSASLPDLQWVIDAYALTLAALMLTAGALADRFGRRVTFAAGTAIFTTGSPPSPRSPPSP